MRKMFTRLAVLGLVALVPSAGWAAWRFRPLPPARETQRVGDYVQTVTYTRTHRWLPPSGWGIHRGSMQGCGTITVRTKWVVLGCVAVEDTWVTACEPAGGP